MRTLYIDLSSDKVGHSTGSVEFGFLMCFTKPKKKIVVMQRGNTKRITFKSGVSNKWGGGNGENMYLPMNANVWQNV